MADEKKVESTVVTLVAAERGFHKGQLIEPGQSFPFDTVGPDGKPRKLPRWAVREGDPRLAVKKPVTGDLKPKAAQLAVKSKAAALTGGDLAG